MYRVRFPLALPVDVCATGGGLDGDVIAQTPIERDCRFRHVPAGTQRLRHATRATHCCPDSECTSVLAVWQARRESVRAKLLVRGREAMQRVSSKEARSVSPLDKPRAFEDVSGKRLTSSTPRS